MQREIVRRLTKRMKPYKWLLAAALLTALFSVPLNLLVPVFIGRAIDAILGVGQVDFPRVLREIAVMALCAAGAAVLQWAMLVCTRRLSALVARDMRREAFARLQQVPFARIDRHRHGDIVSRLVNDADAVAEGVLQGLSQLLPGVATILGTVVVMLMLSAPIALVVIVVTPLSILFANFMGRRSAAHFRAQSAALGAMSAQVNESVKNQTIVRAFGFEDQAMDTFSQASEEYFRTNYKATFYSSVINPGTRLVNAIVYAAVGVFGALYAIAGGITVGGLSAFLSYANQYTKPFNEITAVLTQIQAAIASAERLFEVMDWRTQPPDPADAAAPTHSEGHVQAREVAFAYDKDRPLIRDFTMEAQPGQRIALVGPTGCGKTTVINLLMRFYEVDAGRILVDGTDAAHIRRSALRGLYGMVLQDTWLKEATVRENIAYGRPGASDEEIKAAAKEALAHSFIKRLPSGYDTVIEPGGGNLSAGQKQLLCIARIMLAKPDMLILDEATSSIDTRTEILVQRALERLMQGHTSFVVAHRLSTIQSADLILVMRDGRIIERGRHEELLAQQGFYAKLYQSQFAPG